MNCRYQEDCDSISFRDGIKERIYAMEILQSDMLRSVGVCV